MSLTLLTPAGKTGLLAVNKAAGAIVIPGRGEEQQACVRDELKAQLGREVWVVHRIDRDTSGVLLFALDAQTHRTASMAFEAGEVKKRYVALVQGRLEKPLDIEAALAPARKRKMRIAQPGELGKASRTLIRPRQVFAKATLVEAEPLSGRQHQIRVHLMSQGYPLLVDHQYGRRLPLSAKDLGGEGDTVVLDRTPLHAEWVEIAALNFRAEAPLPADMAEAVRLLSSSTHQA